MWVHNLCRRNYLMLIRVGDVLLRINDVDCYAVNHEVAVNALQISEQFIRLVRSFGYVLEFILWQKAKEIFLINLIIFLFKFRFLACEATETNTASAFTESFKFVSEWLHVISTTPIEPKISIEGPK